MNNNIPGIAKSSKKTDVGRCGGQSFTSLLSLQLEYTVTNSAHLVSTISNAMILNNRIMVSFDVQSLFTNVPIDAAVQATL